MKLVEEAIIIAAGKGTRMLPANLFTPKEFLPLVDFPAIMHLFWEAKLAGISKVHLVLSEKKNDLFSWASEANSELLEERPRVDLPRETLDLQFSGLEIITHVQENQDGVAGAIMTALGSVTGPFLVMLGDNVIIDRNSERKIDSTRIGSLASLELVNKFNRAGVPNAGVITVSDDEISNYGVVCLENERIKIIVEKPEVGDAPSSLVLCGRYIMPEEFSKISTLVPEPLIEERRMISILDFLINNGGLEGVELENYQFYDSGDPIIWLKSQVDHAMRRTEYGDSFKDWIKDRIEEDEW